MNRYALEIMEHVKPYAGTCPYVFGGTRAHNPPDTPNPDLSAIGKSAFSQVLRRSKDSLKIDNFCPHDLRRTGAAWITAVGLSKLYARLMLNHSDGENDVTGEVYVQFSYDFEKRRAAQIWEFILDQVVSCKSLGEIPNLEELRDRVKHSGLL